MTVRKLVEKNRNDTENNLLNIFGIPVPDITELGTRTGKMPGLLDRTYAV